MLHVYADITLYDNSHVEYNANVTTQKLAVIEFRQCVSHYSLWSSVDGMVTDSDSLPMPGDIVLLYSRSRNGQEIIAGDKGD